MGAIEKSSEILLALEFFLRGGNGGNALGKVSLYRVCSIIVWRGLALRYGLSYGLSFLNLVRRRSIAPDGNSDDHDVPEQRVIGAPEMIRQYEAVLAEEKAWRERNLFTRVAG